MIGLWLLCKRLTHLMWLLVSEKSSLYSRLHFNSNTSEAIMPSFLSLHLQTMWGGGLTGRNILQWQLKTPSVSSSQSCAFHINTVEEWICHIMIGSWGMTSFQGTVQKRFTKVLLPAGSLHLNFKDHVCRHDNVVTGGSAIRAVAVYPVHPKPILRF